MPPPAIRADDYLAISDLLARCCWYFDEGDADGYLSVWDDEGELTGFAGAVKGAAGLRRLAQDTYAESQGRLRHVLTNITICYDKDVDSATARGYNLIIRWDQCGKLIFNVHETFELRRTPSGWRLTHVHLQVMQ